MLLHSCRDHQSFDSAVFARGGLSARRFVLRAGSSVLVLASIHDIGLVLILTLEMLAICQTLTPGLIHALSAILPCFAGDRRTSYVRFAVCSESRCLGRGSYPCFGSAGQVERIERLQLRPLGSTDSKLS